MTVRCIDSGTQTAVISTEHELCNIDEIGTFTFHIDLNAMLTGDSLEINIYQKILTGGASRIAYTQTYSVVPIITGVIQISVPISNELVEADALKFTIKQTTGVGRDYPWKVLGY